MVGIDEHGDVDPWIGAVLPTERAKERSDFLAPAEPNRMSAPLIEIITEFGFVESP
jgi:hypothetical protein